MPPDAGRGKRVPAFATIFGFLYFSCLQTDLSAISTPGNGWQARIPAMYRRRNTCNRKPCTHDNDGCRTSVTAAGKHSFPPLLLRRPLSFPVARCAIHPLPFPFRLSMYAYVSMPPSGRHQRVIFVAGAKVKTGLGTQIFYRKISTLAGSGSILSKKIC